MVLGLSGMPSMADARASRSCWLLSTSSWTTNFQVPTRLGVTRTPRSSASISNTLPITLGQKMKPLFPDGLLGRLNVDDRRIVGVGGQGADRPMCH